MANTEVIADIDPKAEKKRLTEEKKKLKAEQKEQKKEAKRRAKELAMQEEQLDVEGGGISVFLVTTLIVIVWIAILCLLIKLDVGGFGSGVLAPVLKDVPIVNKILPATVAEQPAEGTPAAEEPQEEYGGYTSL